MDLMLFLDLLPLIMFVTLVLLLFTGYPVGFVLGGGGLIFGLIGMWFGVFNPAEFFNIMVRIYGGVAENSILVAIPMFIFMGTMLEKSGIGDDLLLCLQYLLRRTPGGLPIAVTLLGTIMAATTGIVGASVTMLTLLCLPVLIAQGYSARLATGAVGAAGTLGILIPPSIMLVLFGDLMTVSVGRLFLGALIPGLVLSTLYMGYIYVVCRTGIEPIPTRPSSDDSRPSSDVAMMVLRSFLPPVVLIGLVLGSLGIGWATSTEAAGVGALGATLIAAANRRLSLPVLQDVLYRSGHVNAMLFLIFIGATAFSYVFKALGGDHLFVDFIERLGAGPWTVLTLMMAVVFVLGFFFEWIEISLIVVPVFLPVITLLDFAPHVAKTELVMWFAILLAVNLQTSFLTPPFGLTLFYMRGAASRDISTASIYGGIIPFVLLQVTGLALVIAFPALALYLPKLAFGE